MVKSIRPDPHIPATLCPNLLHKDCTNHVEDREAHDTPPAMIDIVDAQLCAFLSEVLPHLCVCFENFQTAWSLDILIMCF